MFASPCWSSTRQSIASCAAVAVGVEVGRAVVALDHGQRPARLEHPLQPLQRRRPGARGARARSRRTRGRSCRPRTAASKMSACWKSTLGARSVRLRQRRLGDVDRRDQRAGAVGHQRHGLRAGAAAGLEHAAPGRVGGVVVEQLDERAGLVVQALALALVIAVHVRHGAQTSAQRSRPADCVAFGCVEIELFTDPACPFAFSAEPIRQRLRWHYGDQLTLEADDDRADPRAGGGGEARGGRARAAAQVRHADRPRAVPAPVVARSRRAGRSSPRG